MGAAIERLAALIRRSFSGHADGEKNFSIERALAHRVIAVVGEKNRVVGADGRAVRALENPVAPGAQKIAIAVEDDHRMLAAGKTVNLILLIDRHRGNFVKRPFVGQLAPAFDHFVTIIAASEYDAHYHPPNRFCLRSSILDLQSSNLIPPSCSYTCRHASKPPLMLATFLNPFSIRNAVAPRLLLPW